MGGLLLSGGLLASLGGGVLIWALIDLDGLLDTRRGLAALIAAPIALVMGVRRLRRSVDAP